MFKSFCWPDPAGRLSARLLTYIHTSLFSSRGNVCTYPAPWESLVVGVGSFLCKQLPALTQQNLPANCSNHAWVGFAENLRKICWIIGRKAACVHQVEQIASGTKNLLSADRLRYITIWQSIPYHIWNAGVWGENNERLNTGTFWHPSICQVGPNQFAITCMRLLFNPNS